jgi:hypothetical protein
MKKLFNCQCQFDVVVYVEDESEAENVVYDYVLNSVKDILVDEIFVTQIDNEKDLPPGWDKYCLVYTSDNEEMSIKEAFEIIEKQKKLSEENKISGNQLDLPF